MSGDQDVNFEAPIKPVKKAAKKKPAKKPRAAAAPKKSGSDVPFPGMTRAACAEACNEKGCVIGVSYCAHPCKGGLQSVDQSNRPAMKRLQIAREQLAVKLDPHRFTD